MAAVRLLIPVAVMLLSTVLLTEGMRMTNGPKSCCFDFVQKQLKPSKLVNYQITSQQCSKAGVVFTTIARKQVCANPSEAWVQGCIKALENKNSKRQMKP